MYILNKKEKNHPVLYLCKVYANIMFIIIISQYLLCTSDTPSIVELSHKCEKFVREVFSLKVIFPL